MKRRQLLVVAGTLALAGMALVACSDDDDALPIPVKDAGKPSTNADAKIDSPAVTTPDAASGGGVDAPPVTQDARADVTTTDAGLDAPADAPADVTTEAASDAGADATSDASDAGSTGSDAASEAGDTDAGAADGGTEAGVTCLPAGTITVQNDSFSSWIVNGVSGNPSITLCRGSTYTFTSTAEAGHPFWIRTLSGIGTANAYNDGMTPTPQTGLQPAGTLIFVVPTGAPDTLFYNCQIHSAMAGTINVVTP